MRDDSRIIVLDFYATTRDVFSCAVVEWVRETNKLVRRSYAMLSVHLLITLCGKVLLRARLLSLQIVNVKNAPTNDAVYQNNIPFRNLKYIP